MIDKFLNNKLFKARVIAEVYVTVASQDELEINVVIVKRVKQSLEITRSHRHLHTLEQLIGCVSTDIPLSLIVDGKGVIQKTVKHKEDVPVIYQVLPNARHQEFLWQEITLSREGLTQVAVARKKYIEDWLEKLIRLGYMVLDVSIGPMAISSITSLLPRDLNEIRVKNYKIEYDQQGITEISRNGIDEESCRVRIGNDEISNIDLIPFAASIKYFKPSAISSDGLSGVCRSSRNQYTFKRIYRSVLFISTGLLFGILLVNFLLYNSFDNRYRRYQEEYTENQELLNKLDNLETEYSRRQAFFKDNAGAGNSRYSYYADRLAFLLPSPITLTELTLDPISENIKQGREIQKREGLIIISGETNESLLLNKYIRDIENEYWVEDVNLINYQSEANRKGEFTIEITLKRPADETI